MRGPSILCATQYPVLCSALIPATLGPAGVVGGQALPALLDQHGTRGGVMARTAAPSPSPGQRQRRKHGGRRSRSATAAITGLFLAGVTLLGTAAVAGVTHLASASRDGRAAVRVESSPSIYNYAPPPILPAAPTPRPASTHRPLLRKHSSQSPLT